jgi:hypothetical protein
LQAQRLVAAERDDQARTRVVLGKHRIQGEPPEGVGGRRVGPLVDVVAETGSEEGVADQGYEGIPRIELDDDARARQRGVVRADDDAGELQRPSKAEDVEVRRIAADRYRSGRRRAVRGDGGPAVLAGRERLDAKASAQVGDRAPHDVRRRSEILVADQLDVSVGRRSSVGKQHETRRGRRFLRRRSRRDPKTEEPRYPAPTRLSHDRPRPGSYSSRRKLDGAVARAENAARELPRSIRAGRPFARPVVADLGLYLNARRLTRRVSGPFHRPV